MRSIVNILIDQLVEAPDKTSIQPVWVLPDGTIKILRPNMDHLTYVSDHPQLFGLSKKEQNDISDELLDESTHDRTHKFSPALEAEIEYQIDNFGSPSEDNDFESLTRSDIILRLMQDCDDPDLMAYEFRRELQDYGIEIGIYVANTKQQIDQIQQLGGGKKYDFKRGDRYYTFDSWDPLADADEESHPVSIPKTTAINDRQTDRTSD